MTAQPDILARLQACLADLDGYIAREAGKLAAPMIRAVQDRADGEVRSAQFETRRANDVNDELRRHLRVQEQARERVLDARMRLAMMFGYPVATNPAGVPPLDVLVADVEKALAGRGDHD
jgi:hypothetical protein